MRNPRRSLRLRLWDILNAIETAKLAVDDLTLEAFQADLIRKLAAERSVEIISEASRHVPSELKSRMADLPWAQIAGIGNILRHGYDTVDPEVIWKLTREDLDPLAAAVRLLMAEIEAG